MGVNQSIATAVGFTASAGVSTEFGVIMLIYLKQALREKRDTPTPDDILQAEREGTPLRVRQKR